MEVSSIMSRDLVTVTPTLAVSAALQLMYDEDIRHLPVLENDQLMGVVTDRDLRTLVHEEDAARGVAKASATVADVMQTAISVVAPEDTIVAAAVEFVLLKIGCLPVVQGKQLLGILTEMDMLVAYVKACRRGDLKGEADVPAVSRLMTRDPKVLAPDASVREADALCRRLHARHVPVVDDGRLVGIVSDRDMHHRGDSDWAERTPVGDVMATEVVTAKPDDRLPDAAETMASAKIGALPVVQDGRIVGILTLTDLLDHCMNSLREPDTV